MEYYIYEKFIDLCTYKVLTIEAKTVTVRSSIRTFGLMGCKLIWQERNSEMMISSFINSVPSNREKFKSTIRNSLDSN